MRDISKNEIMQEVSCTVDKVKIFLSSFFNEMLLPPTDEQALSCGIKKSYKLCKWLQQWINYLTFESEFSPQRMKSYKRGEVVYVNFGFNVSCELGGAHYAVVLSEYDNNKKPMLVVAPMTSIKSTTKMNNLGNERISIDGELYDTLISKTNKEIKLLNDEILQYASIDKEKVVNTKQFIKTRDLLKKIDDLKAFLERVNRMKKGSIVNIGQIRAISKMRIIRPKYNSDLLAKTMLKPETMDKITSKLLKNIVKNG